MMGASGETFKLSEAPRLRLKRGSAQLLEAVLQIFVGVLVRNKLISLVVELL
jgi:hypothetical protein